MTMHSTPEELDAARLGLKVSACEQHRDDPLARFLLDAIIASKVRAAQRRQHHPAPLCIDGHAYRRRRRRR